MGCAGTPLAAGGSWRAQLKDTLNSAPMSSSPSRASICLSVLRISLRLGALCDLVLAALLVSAPDLPARLLAVPRPSEEVYLWLLAVMLAALAAVYLLAAYDPMAYAGNVLVAIGGRGAAAAALAAAALTGTGLEGLYLLAAVDLSFAVVHGICWWSIRHLRGQLL